MDKPHHTLHITNHTLHITYHSSHITHHTEIYFTNSSGQVRAGSRLGTRAVPSSTLRSGSKPWQSSASVTGWKLHYAVTGSNVHCTLYRTALRDNINTFRGKIHTLTRVYGNYSIIYKFYNSLVKNLISIFIILIFILCIYEGVYSIRLDDVMRRQSSQTSQVFLRIYITNRPQWDPLL